MLVLGIETSCDETAASLCEVDVTDPWRVEALSSVVASQIEEHSAYGGVVPEIAARAHVEAIAPAVAQALEVTERTPALVAVTAGPGLAGSLIVGMAAAKALAWAWSVPLVAVNHVEAHAYAPLLEGTLPAHPFMALVVSGGHTLLAEVRGPDEMVLIGQTLDDALGEAYDKVAKFLGLPYPGGPVIDKLSKGADAAAIRFPRAMMGSGDFNFSLSGLKTAVIRHVDKVNSEGGELPPVADIVASFQAAALEPVVRKTVAAAEEWGLTDVVVGGGVACNSELRERLARACDKAGLRLVLSQPGLCTDNGAMVAALGAIRHAAGHRSGLDADVHPNLRFGSPMPGDRF